MGDGEPRHVAGDERPHLHVPDRVRGEEAEVGREGGAAEEVPSPAEWIRGEPDRRLALEHEEREVVRDGVDESDGNEAVDERPLQHAFPASEQAGGA